MEHMPAESQFVTFSLGEELFAVPVTVVREILDHEDPFKIPHGPDYLMGLRDVRGQGGKRQAMVYMDSHALISYRLP